MKKLMIIAVAALSAVSAIAQNPAALKQIKKAKTVEEVNAVLSGSSSSMTASENAQAYNKLVDITMASVTAAQTSIQANAVQAQLGKEATEKVDMNAFYSDLYDAFSAALQCDKYDIQPNEKGKVAPKFRKPNGDRMYGLRANLVNAGQDAQTAQDNKLATRYYAMYVTTAKADLFKEQADAATKAAADGVGDPYLSEVARVASLTAFNTGDVKAAMEYADVVMEDPAKAKEGLSLKMYYIEKGVQTKEDSVNCLEQLKQIYEKYPDNSDVFSQLAQWYANLGHVDMQKQLIADRLKTEPNNFTAWAMKGQTEMNEQKYDDAIASYKKSLTCETADNGQKALVNTFIGYCYTQKSTQIENYDDQVKQLKEAIPYLEEARNADPERERCNWAYPLYNCYYYVLGEKDAKTLELKNMLGL